MGFDGSVIEEFHRGRIHIQRLLLWPCRLLRKEVRQKSVLVQRRRILPRPRLLPLPLRSMPLLPLPKFRTLALALVFVFTKLFRGRGQTALWLHLLRWSRSRA